LWDDRLFQCCGQAVFYFRGTVAGVGSAAWAKIWAPWAAAVGIRRRTGPTLRRNSGRSMRAGHRPPGFCWPQRRSIQIRLGSAAGREIDPAGLARPTSGDDPGGCGHRSPDWAGGSSGHRRDRLRRSRATEVGVSWEKPRKHPVSPVVPVVRLFCSNPPRPILCIRLSDLCS
jgi:hypothetical protein